METLTEEEVQSYEEGEALLLVRDNLWRGTWLWGNLLLAPIAAAGLWLGWAITSLVFYGLFNLLLFARWLAAGKGGLLIVKHSEILVRFLRHPLGVRMRDSQPCFLKLTSRDIEALYLEQVEIFWPGQEKSTRVARIRFQLSPGKESQVISLLRAETDERQDPSTNRNAQVDSCGNLVVMYMPSYTPKLADAHRQLVSREVDFSVGMNTEVLDLRQISTSPVPVVREQIRTLVWFGYENPAQRLLKSERRLAKVDARAFLEAAKWSTPPRE